MPSDAQAARHPGAGLRHRLDSEAGLRAIVETAPSVIVCLHLDMAIAEFNPAAERIFGVPRAQAIGRPYVELFPEPVRAKIVHDLARIASGQPVESFENAIRRSDGEVRVVLWNMRRLADSAGEPLGVVAVGQDITRRQLAEEELRWQAHRLAQLTARLEALERATGASLSSFRSELLDAQAALRSHFRFPIDTRGPLARLSPREREVIELVVAGRTGPEIAARLSVSVRTVEVHRARLMVKLGLQGPRELLRFAWRQGLAGPEA